VQKLYAPFRAFCIFPVGFILKTCGQFQQGFYIFTLEAKATTIREKEQIQRALQRQEEKQQQEQQMGYNNDSFDVPGTYFWEDIPCFSFFL